MLGRSWLSDTYISDDVPGLSGGGSLLVTFVGECTHSISFASFKVPSSRHASPMGLVMSLEYVFPFSLLSGNTLDMFLLVSFARGVFGTTSKGQLFQELECMPKYVPFSRFCISSNADTG
jgi:hypothetical protein